MSAVSERIKRLLEEKNMSYGDLERLTGIPKPTLQRYVKGKGGIPLDRLEVIAAALLTTAPALIGWETEIKREEEKDITDLQLAAINRAYREASPEIREAVCRVLGVAYVSADINSRLGYGKNWGGGGKRDEYEQLRNALTNAKLKASQAHKSKNEAGTLGE